MGRCATMGRTLCFGDNLEVMKSLWGESGALI